LQHNIRCRFFHENGRENRNNGNQEKGKKEKEALRSQLGNKRGRRKRPLSFFAQHIQ
jgi:CRISPR/Cas system CSM-associated protein Csm2 small subunit